MFWKELLLLSLLIVPFIYWDLASLSPLIVCFFCSLFAAPVGERSWDEQDRGTDPSNQQVPEEIKQPNDPVDVTDGEVPGSAVLDPSLRQSLRKVFDCSYSQFILLWYNPPEPTEDQPLYHVLLDEFNMAVDHAIGEIRNLDSTRIGLGLIRIFTVHLRTAKKEKISEKIFQTREEEMCFLRRTSEALIRKLLPDSVWKLNVYRHLLREVVALKGLEEVINMVCDSDFINQALIKFLDKDSPVTKEKEGIPAATPQTVRNDEIIIDSDIAKEKKEKKLNAKRVYNIFKKWFKKPKKKETGSTVYHTDEDEVDGPQFRSFTSSDGLDDDSAEEMLAWLRQNILTPTENEKSSLGNCKITISEVSWDEMEDPSCTLDIENLQVAEDCWSVQRKYHEFEDLQKVLSERFSDLYFVEPKLPSVKSMPCDEINDKFKEDVKHQLSGFLEKLVSEESILCNENILNFFSVNDPIRDHWGLLTSLFTEEDEVPSLFTEEDEETDADSNMSDPSDMDVEGDFEPPEKPLENGETLGWDFAESRRSEIDHKESACDSGFRSLQPTSGTTVDHRKRRKRVFHKEVERTTEPPECITSQLHDLLRELICTEHSSWNKRILLQGLKIILPFMKTSLQEKLDRFFCKEQMPLYVDRLRETLWPNGKPAEPPPERSNEEKASAKEKAEELLYNRIVFFRRLSHGKENARLLLTIFQDAETNKRLVYKVLVFLLFEIIPGIKDSWNGNVMPCLKILDADELNDKPL